MQLIFHIASNDDWQQTKDANEYAPEMFATEGFIHCSTRDQIIPVANARFRGQPGLLLLSIDSDKVRHRIVYENLEGGQQLFPHIYGKLNRDAVTTVDEFLPNADGSFTFPGS